jgi:hypothetical protein
MIKRNDMLNINIPFLSQCTLHQTKNCLFMACGSLPQWNKRYRISAQNVSHNAHWVACWLVTAGSKRIKRSFPARQLQSLLHLQRDSIEFTCLATADHIGEPDKSMEPTDNAPPAEVPRVAVQLPPFWTEWPAMWFTQAEVQFFSANINCEQTKFCYVISQLDHRLASEVEAIITSPPEQEPYTTLRTELIRRLSPLREQRIRQFLTLEMGDRELSRFLRHLRSPTPDAPDDFLHTIWSSRLPPQHSGYPRLPSWGQLELRSPLCVPQPTVRTAAPRLHPSQPSLALVHPLTALHFCKQSRVSPARWQHSPPNRTTLSPPSRILSSDPGTLVPGPGTLYPAPATPLSA